MQLGFTVGWLSKDSFALLKDLYRNEFQPDFIVFCLYTPSVILPKYNFLKRFFLYLKSYKHWMLMILPKKLIFFLFFWRKYLFCKKKGSRTFFINNINSKEFIKIIRHETPKAVVVVNCGILKPFIVEKFPNLFINAHAGKLPDYRGMNNVEWACFENSDIIGTIHFIDRGIDTGDIILQKELPIPTTKYTLNMLREVAFKRVRSLIPHALKILFFDNNFQPESQQNRSLIRYEMHPFLKAIVVIKLNNPISQIQNVE